MPKEKSEKKNDTRRIIGEGYKPEPIKPIKKGYQPNQGNLDTSNPPGSGASDDSAATESNSSDNTSTAGNGDS
ncbi:MAG: hypothetical protein KAR44_04045 [Candidatus Aegiribacteria sp.]|nr:hypothetical protein [Candidatus Aegiribacteria sp.]